MIRLRTGYSFRTAIGSPTEAVEAYSKGWMGHYVPITDRVSTYAWRRFRDVCKEKGMIPVYGVELGVARDISAKRPVVDHWVFFPAPGAGIAALNDLISTATSQFRYEPLLTYEQALGNPSLIVITGHRADTDYFLLSSAKYPHVYAPLSAATPYGFAKKMAALAMKFAAVGNNVYPATEDAELYEIICGRGASMQTYPQHILTEDEWRESVELAGLGKWAEEALSNRSKILEQASRGGAPTEARLPSPPVEFRDLEKIAREGAKKLGVDLDDEAYKARFERELEIIRAKNFEDYFLIVVEIAKWARERMLVGPARGSAAGSLICYLTEITTIDPLKHDLIFERFVDITRDDLPDIDIDFSDARREDVIEHIREVYGADHVAKLGTVAYYKPRSILKEASGAFGIPPWELNAVLDSMIERSSGDARAQNTLEDTFTDTAAGRALIEKYPQLKIAARMEGRPRHSSTHASAVVLSSEALDEIAPINHRTECLQLDKKDAEALGILKVDILGLKQLAIFEDAIESVDMTGEDLANLPLDDQASLDVLNRGKFAGIFQFSGNALKSISRDVEVKGFNEICSITALARPGPLASGNTLKWTRLNQGRVKANYFNKLFRQCTEETQGIIIYQEQIMRLGRELGGLNWAEVTHLRQSMSKSLGKEHFDKFGDKWKAGAVKNGLSASDAADLWENMCDYGSWSFNKSHAVAYSLLTYYCLWLKAHYPGPFAAATLNHKEDIDAQRELLQELDGEGFNYRPVDPEKSTDKWTLDGDTLVGPLSNIKGVGPKTTSLILGARKRGEKLPQGVLKKLQNPVTDLDELYPIKTRVAELYPDLREVKIISKPRSINSLDLEPTESLECVLIGTLSKINVRDENEAVLVAKRGYKLPDHEPLKSLNLRIKDDTGLQFGKIARWNYDRIGRAIVERGNKGGEIYAFKGTLKFNIGFRIYLIEGVKHLGSMA